MPPASSEPAISAGERPQIRAIHCAAIGIDFYLYVYIFMWAGIAQRV